MSIKLFFTKKDFKFGPQIFRDRLRPALKKIDYIDVVANKNKNFDVELSFIKIKTHHSKPVVLRLDGCYYRPKHLSHNAPLISSIRRAKKIIFQSSFSSEMIHKILRVKINNKIVIHNGINLDWVSSIKPNPIVEPGSFVASANWKRRPNKRPLSILKGFVKAKTGRKLYMIGNYHKEWAKKYQQYGVIFMGSKTISQVISIMKSCDYMLHLCHIDSCPNAVVEGLACGLKILCTNLGGTKEIVKDDGIVMNVDRWNFKPFDFVAKNIDSLNPSIVADGIKELMVIKGRTKRPDLDISITANKYANVIKSCMS